MISQRCFTGLLAAVVGLPIVILIAAAVRRLLNALGDQGGAALLDRLAVLGLVGWLTTLVGLLVCLAIRNLGPPADEEELR